MCRLLGLFLFSWVGVGLAQTTDSLPTPPADYPKELVGYWYRTFGTQPEDSLIRIYFADGRFESKRVIVVSGLRGLEARYDRVRKGRWIVRQPVEGEFLDRTRGQYAIQCTQEANAKAYCSAYSVTKYGDRTHLSLGSWDQYWKLK